ncbi:hypothetical protein Q31b_45650 [Novipirellula aureliae]|uniref:Uncharacterized protein n=1 Tax=Novipirellula aureliae TaxID=2527966 RepID=A0A5C6DRX5_9BACT|nr:hypothetical protein Q31b_45650 [Novipirellula aureliae]
MACTGGILKRETFFRRACLGGGNKWRPQTARRPKEIRPTPTNRLRRFVGVRRAWDFAFMVAAICCSARTSRTEAGPPVKLTPFFLSPRHSS